MTEEEVISMLERFQDPEQWEPQITRKAFEALNIAISAVKKQVKRRPVKIAPFGGGNMINTCPSCGHILQAVSKYCSNCGQRIIWENDNVRSD